MPNLKSRRLRASDLELLRLWRMHPDVTKYLFTDPLITTDDQRLWFKQLQQKNNSIYWIITYYAQDIGYASLTHIDRKNKRADPGVYICETGYRYRGFGKSILHALQKYAFERLHLHKLTAQVLSHNHAALNLYSHSGWSVQGILRDHILKDKFYDVTNFSLLKEDHTN